MIDEYKMKELFIEYCNSIKDNPKEIKKILMLANIIDINGKLKEPYK